MPLSKVLCRIYERSLVKLKAWYSFCPAKRHLHLSHNNQYSDPQKNNTQQNIFTVMLSAAVPFTYAVHDATASSSNDLKEILKFLTKSHSQAMEQFACKLDFSSSMTLLKETAALYIVQKSVLNDLIMTQKRENNIFIKSCVKNLNRDEVINKKCF